MTATRVGIKMRSDRREMKRERGGLNAIHAVKAIAFTIRAAPFNSFLALGLLVTT